MNKFKKKIMLYCVIALSLPLISSCTKQNNVDLSSPSSDVSVDRGEKPYTIEVSIDPANSEKYSMEITTDSDTLGDALVENDVVKYSETAALGRFIDSVNGVESLSKKYWIIYVDGVSSSVGMDDILLSDSAKFSLVQE